MAEVNGVNYASSIAIPQEQLPVGEVSGKVRVAYDSYTFAANVLAIGDIVNVCAPLPKGARIIDALVLCPSLGTTGIMDLGYADDPNYLVSGADAGGALAAKHMSNEAGLLAKLDAAIQPQLIFTEASDAASGVEVKVAIKYVLE